MGVLSEPSVWDDNKSNFAKIYLETAIRKIDQLDLPHKLIDFGEYGSEYEVSRQLWME